MSDKLYTYLKNKPNKDEFDKGFLACLEMLNDKNINNVNTNQPQGSGEVTEDKDARIKADVYNMHKSYMD